MLDSLNDQPVGSYRLRVASLGKTRFFDQVNFELYLLDSHNNKSESPVFRGLYNAGRPSIFVPAWIDGEFIENPSPSLPLVRSQIANPAIPSGTPRPLAGVGLGWGTPAEEIAQKLGALIPPGGRFWLAYEAFEGEGEMMRETRAGLLASMPLVTTPIGFLLYRADCWLGLRDWHFPEGGREGPRKLQGNKAVSVEHLRQRASESIAELENFVHHRADNEVLKRAQARAGIVLPSLRNQQ